MQDLFKNLDKSKYNVWRYNYYYPQQLDVKDQLTIDNDFSPLETYNDFYIKREDKNKSGSLKSRGISYQLAIAKKNKIDKFVLSTSGNAGITTSLFLKKYGGNLIVVTSENVPDRKIEKLKNTCSHLLIAKNPTHIANYISKKYSLKNLRPSRDQNSIPGYYSLGFETYEQIQQDIDNIFIYSSSGSSFIGLFESFKILKKLNIISKIPKMFATRRQNVVNFRHKQVLDICHQTGGKEIIVNNTDFDAIDFDTSHEGRSAMFAALKENPTGTTVIYLTGKKYTETFDTSLVSPIIITNLTDVDKYMKSNFINS